MNASRTHSFISRIAIGLLAFTVTFSGLTPTPLFANSLFHLPAPGTMLSPSERYTPAIMAGLTIYPDNPLKFDFIVDTGDDNLQGDALRKESHKLINYFLTTLTVPDDEMWVNLSPYEKNRIIANGLGDTEMGRDMLAQDYLLKQLTASLMYPEKELGDTFWKTLHAKVQDRFGTTEIPSNTFNKVWIVPEEAIVFLSGTNVFVSKSHLKVYLEEDYLTLHENTPTSLSSDTASSPQDVMTDEAKEAIREVILPAIEQEVNHGKNFANLRQIYNAMILATWYKKNLKESILGQVYMDRNKTAGIDLEDKQIKERIYEQYVAAFKKGVYDYIKEDYDTNTQKVIPRKYFSGGLDNVTGKLRTQSLTTGNQIASTALVGERQRVRAGQGIHLQRITVNIPILDGTGDVIALPNRTGDNAMLAQPGLAFIFGTGNNGTVVDENGQIYTDNDALLELGHNILFRARLNQWVFTGKEMRGDKPSLANGLKEVSDLSFEESFSGPNLARRFARYPDALSVAEQFIAVADYPEGVTDAQQILDLLTADTVADGDEKKVAQSINKILIGVSKAVAANNAVAIQFTREMGIAIGEALAALFKEYANDRWVENFVLVSGVGENFARVDGVSPEDDVLIRNIRQSLRDELIRLGVAADRSAVIAQGVVRSDISWEREISAARLTIPNLEDLSARGESMDNAASIGISLGGTKIGGGLLTPSGDITIRPKEIQWQQNADYNDGTSEGIVRGIINQIANIVDEDGQGVNRIKKIGLAFAGPVDREAGIVGTPFPAPNLPFDAYDLRNALQRELESRYGDQLSANLIIDIYNDGAAAVLGEVSSPQGQLRQIAFGPQLPTNRTTGGDQALLSNPGGIDFNPSMMNLQESGQAITFELDNSLLNSIPVHAVEGVQPVIINVTPIINLVPLLGTNTDQKSNDPTLSRL